LFHLKVLLIERFVFLSQIQRIALSFSYLLVLTVFPITCSKFRVYLSYFFSPAFSYFLQWYWFYFVQITFSTYLPQVFVYFLLLLNQSNDGIFFLYLLFHIWSVSHVTIFSKLTTQRTVSLTSLRLSFLHLFRLFGFILNLWFCKISFFWILITFALMQNKSSRRNYFSSSDGALSFFNLHFSLTFSELANYLRLNANVWIFCSYILVSVQL